MSKMITIVGPTGSGKSAMAMKLAEGFNGQIICADSRTVYRGMDIGTAKPSKVDQSKVKHYLLDIVDPDEVFSVAEFKETALEAIKEVSESKHLSIMAGGSGLYIDSVLFDYKFRDQPKPKQELSGLSDEELVSLATALHPNTKLESKNLRRVKQLIARGPAQDADRRMQKVDSLVLGIYIEKLMLKQNITNRAEQFLNNGFVQEVEDLVNKYGADAPGLQSTGYAAVVEYLSGKLKKEELKEKIVADTMKLAKKQLTWFKRNPDIVWLNDYDQARGFVQEYLQS
ncbi:tRNA (adenosine(37)-N6)-dimethylallyltransferase MiaA [Candidatus Saccharibacteria bacterium]|nr:tRNA (adenosine(37)-N6)-dimethylallyltransferase MiaA [Candidatus Saccharibacteria bacterium]